MRDSLLDLCIVLQSFTDHADYFSQLVHHLLLLLSLHLARYWREGWDL